MSDSIRLTPSIAYGYERLRSLGLSDQQAYGVLGSIMQESGPSVDPRAVNPVSGAFGVAQHLGVRQEALREFARRNRRDVEDYRTQWDFIAEELRTTERRAFDRVRASSTRGDAAYAWTRYFERPHASEYHMTTRNRYTDRVATVLEEARGRIGVDPSDRLGVRQLHLMDLFGSMFSENPSPEEPEDPGTPGTATRPRPGQAGPTPLTRREGESDLEWLYRRTAQGNRDPEMGSEGEGVANELPTGTPGAGPDIMGAISGLFGGSSNGSGGRSTASTIGGLLGGIIGGVPGAAIGQQLGSLFAGQAGQNGSRSGGGGGFLGGLLSSLGGGGGQPGINGGGGDGGTKGGSGEIGGASVGGMPGGGGYQK